MDDSTMMEDGGGALVEEDTTLLEEQDDASESPRVLLQAIRDLEEQLKRASKKEPAMTTTAAAATAGANTPTHQKQLFQVRKSLRRAYCRFISADLAAAASMDMETSLWKHTIYKQLDSLRKMLRQCSSASTDTTEKAAHQADRYQQFHALTTAFLQVCMRLYERMFFTHLRHTDWEAQTSPDAVEPAEHEEKGHESSHSSTPLRLPHILLRPATSQAASDAASRHLYLQSCHRCLLFRGDIERYYQLIQQEGDVQRSKHLAANSASAVSSPPSSYKPDWDRVERFYLLAVTLMPSSGQPWNQLAVVAATYQRDTLLAVYRYFRALSAVTPFPTSAVNVKLLFSNTLDDTVYATHAKKHATGATMSTPLFPDTNVCARFMNTPWLDFAWVHLFHLLATPNHLQLHNALPCVAFAVIARFSQQMRGGATLKIDFALRLVLNFLFGAEPTTAKTESSDTVMADANQPHRELEETSHVATSAALSICCEFLSVMMSSLQDGTNPLLGVVVVFLIWLQLHPAAAESLAHDVPLVRESFFHQLARLANVASEHLGSASSTMELDGDISTLPEDRAILGVASLVNDLHLDDGLEAGASVDVRRCHRLVHLTRLLASSSSSLLVEDHAGFRSTLDEVPASHSASAPIVSLEPLQPTLASPVASPPQPVVPPVQPPAVSLAPAASPAQQPEPATAIHSAVSMSRVGADLAAAFARVHTASSHSWSSRGMYILLPTTLPAPSLACSQQLSFGFAPVPTTAPLR